MILDDGHPVCVSPLAGLNVRPTVPIVDVVVVVMVLTVVARIVTRFA